MIEKISEAVNEGRTYTYIGCDEGKLHDEIIRFLLEKGYDIEMTHYRPNSFKDEDVYFYKCFM